MSTAEGLSEHVLLMLKLQNMFSLGAGWGNWKSGESNTKIHRYMCCKDVGVTVLAALCCALYIYIYIYIS